MTDDYKDDKWSQDPDDYRNILADMENQHKDGNILNKTEVDALLRASMLGEVPDDANYCIEEDLAESYAREKRLEERLDILRKCQQRFIHFDPLFSTMETSDPFRRALKDIWVTMATALREDL